MQLTVDSVDYAPEELYGQLPVVIELIRQIPGNDRPDYWIGNTSSPIRYFKDNHEIRVTHVILAARWVGTTIKSGIKNMPVGIAYVTDASLLEDERLEFKKCDYVAIGIATDTSSEDWPPLIVRNIATILLFFAIAFLWFYSPIKEGKTEEVLNEGIFFLILILLSYLVELLRKHYVRKFKS